MTFSTRWIFAVVAICCGIYCLIKSAGDTLTVVTGVGLIAAGIGLVAP